jgi:CheY-like chemotaxis protein
MDPSLCVLVVDDDPNLASLWCLLLSQWGHRPLLAYDAAAARAVARAERPDVVLLDIGLPGADGWDLACRLRADPGLPDLRLIAVTGRLTDADREKSAQVGIRQHLVKPVDPELLRRLLVEA